MEQAVISAFFRCRECANEQYVQLAPPTLQVCCEGSRQSVFNTRTSHASNRNNWNIIMRYHSEKFIVAGEILAREIKIYFFHCLCCNREQQITPVRCECPKCGFVVIL